jgi:HAD superfamily phosphatase
VIFDIDGVVRDVSRSYRRALADTVEHFTQGAYRPTMDDIDRLKAEGCWNNDWLGSQELIYRYFESQGQGRDRLDLDYEAVVDFFQHRYRGPNLTDPDTWTGYISDEPLLMSAGYLAQLSAAGIAWGFFSGATRGSANFVLTRRLELANPVLVAMEDAPDKPDPTGLFAAIAAIETQVATLVAAQPGTNIAGRSNPDMEPRCPVVYAGDTVSDMQVIGRARQVANAQPGGDRLWRAAGILPPHVHQDVDRARAYRDTLTAAGADRVFVRVEALTPEAIVTLIES